MRARRRELSKGYRRKSAHIWYIRRLRDSHTLSRPVLFGPEVGPSMGPMYTSERAQYSKGYRAAELCRNLAEELGNDRGGGQRSLLSGALSFKPAAAAVDAS